MRNYRILRFSAKHEYDVLKGLGDTWLDKSFAEIQASYQANRFIYGNDFSRIMRQLGNEAQDLVYDVEFLQKKWIEEHCPELLGRISDTGWMREIIRAQINFYRPDVIYTNDILFLPLDDLRNLKRDFPFLRLLVAQKGYPHAFEELAQADLVYTCTPRIVEQFREQGINARLLYHCFDEGVLEALGDPVGEPLVPAGFIGSSGYGFPRHGYRYGLLDYLLERSPLQAWLHEFEPRRKIAGQAPLRQRHPRNTHEPVFGLDMYRVLRRCGVALNVHTDAAEGYVGNMRLFEATGVGACLLTDAGRNLGDVFDPDREVVVYSTPEDCLDKLRLLLGDGKLRENIAAEGKRRTLREHTLKDRCMLIHHDIARTL